MRLTCQAICLAFGPDVSVLIFLSSILLASVVFFLDVKIEHLPAPYAERKVTRRSLGKKVFGSYPSRVKLIITFRREKVNLAFYL